MNHNIAKYKQHLNLQKANFSRIDHEDALVAIVYKVTQPQNIQLILKICTRPDDYYREMYFLKYFANMIPVPHIIQNIEPAADINGAILMECLPGNVLRATDVTDKFAYEIGSQLARIHLNRADSYGDLTQPHELSPDPRIHFTRKFDEGMMECEHHLHKTLLQRCRQYFDKHITLLTLVDGPCIIHRDFRPGNIIAHEGKLKGIIDWSSARASFAEEDFCSLELGEWTLTNAIKISFLEGYASIRPVQGYNKIMPLLCLNKAIATIGFTVKSETWQGRDTYLYQRNRQFLEKFISDNF